MSCWLQKIMEIFIYVAIVTGSFQCGGFATDIATKLQGVHLDVGRLWTRGAHLLLCKPPAFPLPCNTRSSSISLPPIHAHPHPPHACMQVAVKTLELSFAKEHADVWLQHELAAKISALLEEMSECKSLSHVYGLCVRGHELCLVSELYPISLKAVINTLHSRGRGIDACYSSHLVCVYAARRCRV